MTLDEFRRNWTLPAESHEPVAPPPLPSQRLMFLPPEDPVIVPRLVFREAFTPTGVMRPPRPRARGLVRVVLWSLIAVCAVGGLAVGLDKMFQVADGYVETYVLDQD